MNHPADTTWPLTLEHDQVGHLFIRGADGRAIPREVFHADCVRRAQELRREQSAVAAAAVGAWLLALWQRAIASYLARRAATAGQAGPALHCLITMTAYAWS